MNRRFFLRSAGGLMLAAPFLPSLGQRAARAEGMARARRSVIFHTPCGCLTSRWFPRVEHGALDANALAGTTLEILTPFVKKLLVPRGLRAINSYTLPQTLDPHDQAMGSKLTCALIGEDKDRYATSHSLDHEIAGQINGNGRAPLVLSVGSFSSSPKMLLSYSAPNTPFLPILSPAKAYAGLSGLVTGQSAELERHRLRKRSVLDLVRNDLQAYQRLNMSAVDRERISVWLDLMRDTEEDLRRTACNASAVGLDSASVEAASQSSEAAEAFTLGADAMFKVMALNLLCDNNRSLLIHFPSYATFNWDGIHHTHDHDGLAHRTGDFTVGGDCLPGVLGMLHEIDRWYAGKFAKLVALLDSLPEGDGTVLDQTATTWLQEFSDGSAFNLNNMPIVIAGSAGGYLKQGVAVNVEGAPIGPGNSEANCASGGADPISAKTGSTGGNVPINKLYVTLMNALGCKASDGGEVKTFGQLDGFTRDSGITDPGELVELKA
ncbi:MAG TPA: DUF1552 domain-containing protein [Polyangiaceae bacterium]|nr:DUF1552 domain-containing protein [Polyangiaceae bacterium]